MGTDKALAGVFHSPEPHLTLQHSPFFTDHIFTVPGSLAKKLLPHTELKRDQLHAFMSRLLQKAWEKNPTAVISCDKQNKSSAANQRANLRAAGLGCLLPPSLVLAEMESSIRITYVPQGCTKTGARGSGAVPPAELGIRK